VENNNLILPIGTQIVILIEVKVLNEIRFQPRGTVGVIKSAPKDATHSYLIEFLDGTISTIKRNEFAIRKHYQTDEAIHPLKDQNFYKFVRTYVSSDIFND
jgi:hypothetical protein